MKRWAVFGMCIAWLLTLLGCGKGKPFMLDGPGMEYVPPWTGFTLSRSDSDAQYNFSFTVTEEESVPLVSGVCRDEDGNEYETENGIAITGDTLWVLRRLYLEQLPDAIEAETGPEMLDGSNCTLSVVQNDGTAVKKKISTELSLEIYQLLLPYFINNQS